MLLSGEEFQSEETFIALIHLNLTQSNLLCRNENSKYFQINGVHILLFIKES